MADDLGWWRRPSRAPVESSPLVSGRRGPADAAAPAGHAPAVFEIADVDAARTVPARPARATVVQVRPDGLGAARWAATRSPGMLVAWPPRWPSAASAGRDLCRRPCRFAFVDHTGGGTVATSARMNDRAAARRTAADVRAGPVGDGCPTTWPTASAGPCPLRLLTPGPLLVAALLAAALVRSRRRRERTSRCSARRRSPGAVRRGVGHAAPGARSSTAATRPARPRSCAGRTGASRPRSLAAGPRAATRGRLLPPPRQDHAPRRPPGQLPGRHLRLHPAALPDRAHAARPAGPPLAPAGRRPAATSAAESHRRTGTLSRQI